MRALRAAIVLSLAAFASLPGASAEPAAAAKPRVALVLSGGSALGIAHIGVIRELEKAGIPIDMVLGTSMGSLIGGLYAAGYSPDEMEAIVNGLDWTRYFREGRSDRTDRYLAKKHRRLPLSLGFDGKKPLLESGLIKGQNLLSLFSALTIRSLPTRNFDELPIPFRAVAADIVTGEKVVFSSGSLAEAMRASMSIPGVFSPYEMDGRSLVDGGIADNMPVDVARAMGADIVIAVESRQRSPESAAALDSTFKITSQTVNLFIEENMRPSRKSADLYIRPDLTGYTSMSFADSAALIARGEAGARADEPAIRALAERISAARPLVEPGSEPNRRAKPVPPVMSRLDVEAPSAEDEAVARKAFGGLVGKPLDRQSVEAAFDEAYASGGYSLVKLDLLDEGGHLVGLVRMTAEEPRTSAILFGGSYRGLLSKLRTSEASARFAAYTGDLLAKGSALYFEFGIGSLTRAYAEYLHPIGPFVAMPFVSYKSLSDFYSLGSGLALRADYSSAGGGMALGLGLGKRADLSLGWACDSVKGLDGEVSSDPESALPSTERDSAAYLFFVLDADDRPGSVFPERGFAANLRGRWADPAFGFSDSFMAVELGWNAAIPIAARTTIGLAGCAATDFSDFVPGVSALPSTRLFELRGSGMFYGLETAPDGEYGHNLLGLGLELRQNLGRVSRLLGGDIFGLANLSAAAAYSKDDPHDGFPPLRWNPSLGLGLRVSRDFGMLLALGCVFDSGEPDSFKPALSFQLGSLAYYPEDRR